MNLVVLFGVLSSNPTIRELPSGESLISLQVTTSTATGRRSVPVCLSGSTVALCAGDEIAVLGTVQRRFFRSGGVTRSATEVLASSVVSAGDRRRVAKLLARAGAIIQGDAMGT